MSIEKERPGHYVLVLCSRGESHLKPCLHENSRNNLKRSEEVAAGSGCRRGLRAKLQTATLDSQVLGGVRRPPRAEIPSQKVVSSSSLSYSSSPSGGSES